MDPYVWIASIVAAVVGILLIYALIPDLFAHWLGVGAWKRHYSAGVSLTFDDGPDPRYTPVVLDFLSEKNVKACFFVVAVKALENPELILRMKNEGHQIACHGYRHIHGWTMSPRKTWERWTRAIQQLEEILEEEVHYVRAPWGAANLALLLWCKAKGKKLVGWTVMGRDWKRDRSPEEIVDSVVRKIDHGTIVLLHDSGGEEGAPLNTLEALPLLERTVSMEKKLPFAALEFPNWTWKKRIGFRLWEKWEQFYARYHHVERISATSGFRIALGTYSGPDLLDERGKVQARNGDVVGMLHLENILFQKMGTDPKKIGLKALRLIRRSMKEMALFIDEDPRYKEVQAFVGVTLLNRGVKGLGFNVEETPRKHGGIIAFIQQVVYKVYNPAGKKKTGEEKSRPKVIWISREKLLEKYLSRSVDVNSENLL